MVNASPDVSSIAIPSDSKFLTYTLPISFRDLSSLSKESLSEKASKLPLLLLITTFPVASKSPSKVFIENQM